MSIKKIPFKDHDEWLSIRNKYIGGSDAGTVMGLNPYCSPYTLFCQKTGKVAAFEGNITTKVGSYLEELVAQMFTGETGKKVQRCNFTLVNDDYPWACANVDRMVVGEDAILECKTTNSYVNVKKFKNGDYPEQWYCQMTHYLAVTGKKKAYLAVLSECREFRVFELERDEEEIAALMEAEKLFWEHVTKNIPPSVDGSESTTDTLKTIYREDGTEGELFGLDQMFVLRENIMNQIKQLETMKTEYENNIAAAMGCMSKATCGKWSVSYKEQERVTFDWRKFEKDMPGIPLGIYKKTSKSRPLKITEKRSS